MSIFLSKCPDNGCHNRFSNAVWSSAEIFHKDEDDLAFEAILGQALELYQVEQYRYEVMPNHFLALRPLFDGEISRFMKWASGTHTMRHSAHSHTCGSTTR